MKTIYCCYYSQIDKNGKKLNLNNLSRKDSIYKEIEAESLKEAISLFRELNPTLRLIGVRKDRKFESVAEFNSGLIGKLYKR